MLREGQYVEGAFHNYYANWSFSFFVGLLTFPNSYFSQKHTFPALHQHRNQRSRRKVNTLPFKAAGQVSPWRYFVLFLIQEIFQATNSHWPSPEK